LLPIGNKEIEFRQNLLFYSRTGTDSAMKMTTEGIGETVRARRKLLGMNQSELAMVSGTGVRFISDLENGKESCELGKTLKVLKNLGIRFVITTQGGV
jgi:y4mF family transcriptional regulator